MYVVKFFNLTESTMDEFEYQDLFSAIKVAKETNLGTDNLILPAMDDDKFNEELLILLTTSLVYAGRKTKEHPEGEFMIMLTQRDDETREETTVYNALPMPPLSISSPVAKITTVPLQQMGQNH